MRDTVYCVVGDCDEHLVRAAVEKQVGLVASYVPGYRLKQDVQIRPITAGDPLAGCRSAPPRAAPATSSRSSSKSRARPTTSRRTRATSTS